MNRFFVRYFVCLLIAVPAGFLGADSGPTYVSEPVAPTISPAVRDLPTPIPGSNPFGREMQRRQDYGFVGPDRQGYPWNNPLEEVQSRTPAPDPPEVLAFGTPILNFTGATSPSSPPDTTGEVGPNHFLEAVNDTNSTSASTIRVFNKSGIQVGSDFMLQSLASGAPCSSGYCDPIVLYDEMADRWVISEFPSSGGHLCVYVSQTADPTGAWYAYYFANVETSTPDYPKYGTWPLDTNGDGLYNEGSYFLGVNAGSGGKDLIALDRGKMLLGQPATFQKFTVPVLSGFGFQLLLPGNHEGDTPPPPGNQPCVFLRPVDTEIHSGKTCSGEPCDLMEAYAVTVDWATPANSTNIKLPDIKIAEYDHTLCGTGSTWNCMPQPPGGTTQKIDPIREPIHFPLQYRNWGAYQTLVGCFAEDVDGTDRAAVHWFEIRKTGAGAWTTYQEGVLSATSGSNTVNRSICSAAMDGSGNIAVGYTRTGALAPYYPSIYYAGRLSTDPLGTMPYFEYKIQDATNSNTDNERYGDYAGIGVDPVDDCTFWFVTEYGGSGQTKIATFKFDACGCLAVPPAPTASASVPGDNQINVNWNDSSTSSITRYWIYRATIAGGPYEQIAEVADDNSPSYTYTDNTVSGGIRYYYIVKANDGAACTSPASNEVNALATGSCTLAPTFAGVASVTNPQNATCTLALSWTAGTALCGGPTTYNIYRSTTAGFTPSPANRIALNHSGTTYSDSSSLDSGTTYYYVVRAVDSGNGVEESNLTEKSAAPTGPGGGPQTLLAMETFEGTWGPTGSTPPAGWTIEDHGDESPKVWNNNDWYKYNKGGAYGNVARVYYSPLENQDEWLITPAFSIPSNASVMNVEFDHYFYVYASGEFGYVDASSTQNPVWTTVKTFSATTGTTSTYAHEAVSLLAFKGQTGIKVRFRYFAYNGWYWELDNVTVTGVVDNPCTPASACPMTVSVTPDAGTACVSGNIVFTATPAGGTGPYTYQWTQDGVPISGQTTATLTRTFASAQSHTYNCMVTDTGDPSCVDVTDTAASTGTWNGPPAAPGAPTLTPACTSVDLSWTAVSGATDYEVWRRAGANCSSASAVVTTTGGATTFDNTGLTGSTQYSYFIKAKSACGTSANGSCATTTTLTCVPSVIYDSSPGLVQVTGDGDGVVEPGELWQVTVRLRNNGTAAAGAVQATLQKNAGSTVGVTAITGNPGAYGSIAAGATADAAFTFCVDPASACGNTLVFDVVNITWTGGGAPPSSAMAAITIPVGSAVNESGTANPAAAVNTTQNAAYSTPFTAPSADAATVDYTFTYAVGGGPGQTLFAVDDDPFNSGLWTTTGGSSASETHCGGASDLHYLVDRNGTAALASPISTVGYTNIHVIFDAGLSAAGATVYLEWSTNGTAWTTDYTFTGSTTWQCAVNRTLPAGAQGQAALHLRFRATGSNSSQRAKFDRVSILGDGTAGGTWNANVRTQLVAPDATVLTLKDYGAAETSPASHDVAAFYTAEGPGVYTLRITENIGGTADITASTMAVAYSNCDIGAACGGAAPGEVGTTTNKFSGKNTVAWTAVAGATAYRVYRGIKGALPSLLNGTADSCTRCDGAGLSCDVTADDPSIPADKLYWYLIAAYNAFGEGMVGNASSGPRTLNTTGVCP